MRLPAPLLRRNPCAHKNDFGHVLILAGSARMLGAAALTSLSAMRAGSGLVTLGIPESLNLAAQKKISPIIMTWPLPETKTHSLSHKAFPLIKKEFHRYDVIAIGPGLSQDPSTKKLILKIIASSNKPLVIDADALNAVASDLDILRKTKTFKILTPHPGEMGRLIKHPANFVEKNRNIVSKKFTKKHNCVLVLKGHRTIIAGPKKIFYINKTGNVGMATAGSGDVLTGIIAAFLAQKIDALKAALIAVNIHGRAGDLAARCKGKASLIATDILESIPQAIRKR